MDNNFLPTTETELEYWMKENGFNFIHYAINGNSIEEGFGIEKSEGKLVWYYIDQGKKYNIQSFRSERDIVAYAYEQIRSDERAKAHCIGFSASKTLIDELKNELQKKNIEYIGDAIPQSGRDELVYRIFVLESDIIKTAHLQRKYLSEK
jgi:hypothetical protein